MRRPHTRSSLPKSSASFDQHPIDPQSLMTKQKSLPDVSGISVFAYSMGRPGVIRPPDVTDQLATARAKDTKSNRFNKIGLRSAPVKKAAWCISEDFIVMLELVPVQTTVNNNIGH